MINYKIKFKKKLLERGLSITQLAKDIGRSRIHTQQCINGHTATINDTVRLIAAYLGVEIKEKKGRCETCQQQKKEGC